MSVIILADREFGSVARLQAVKAHGWHDAIRLKDNLLFYDRQWGQLFDWQPLRVLAPAKGEQRAYRDIAITQGELYAIHLAASWSPASDEPWLIATNLPDPLQALKEYRRRFGCEELFSDWKKRDFNWENSRIRAPQRFARLLLALALLTVFLLALGRHLRLHHFDLELMTPAHRRYLSLFQTARRWLFSRPIWYFV